MMKQSRDFHTIIDLVSSRAQMDPMKVGCIFLHKNNEDMLTYGELDTRARAIAATLQAKGMQQGDRILLMFPPGLDFIQAFIGCIYAGCIAVPTYPPIQDKLIDKAAHIIANSQPRLVLMLQDHLDKYTIINSNGPEFINRPAIAMEDIDSTMSTQWQMPLITKDDIAFLQYTSGSTMHPKGVILSHHNLLDNFEIMYQCSHMNEDTVNLSWLPPHHDMGLIGSILTSIYGGLIIILMSPFDFLQRPLSWLQYITKYRATITGGPNFAYDYCIKRIKEDKKEGLDLSSWLLAYNAAEPVRHETQIQFYKAFKDYGLRQETLFPCYGLAEATLLVSGGPPGVIYNTVNLAKGNFQDNRIHFTTEDDPNNQIVVSCGKLFQTVKIVDPDTRLLCDADQVGEIWVHSDSVAQGYWQLEEETTHAFKACIQGDETGRYYLRTGDLGFIHNNELYITGRIKDLIIMYGKNHYPQDIEYTLSHSPVLQQLGKCAAFAVQQDQDYHLTLLCEVNDKNLSQAEYEQLLDDIFNLVYKHHQLETQTIALVPTRTLPHTTSGKIQRNFCRQQLLDKSLPVIAMKQLSMVEE